MKNLKKKFRFRINLKSKHLLAIMTLFCLSCIVATFASGISTAPLQETAGIVIVPFDGIRVDNNVIAGKGLVGIVTEVGSSWATVRSIIDDSSSVSAMTVSTSDNCIVNGDLELIDEGKLRFEQLYDQENKVTVGERIVTSNISEKFVEGLFIGYVSEVQVDINNLTKTGTIVTPVDFLHLKDVFVITVNKQDLVDGTAQVEGNSDSTSGDSSQESSGSTDSSAADGQEGADEG